MSTQRKRSDTISCDKTEVGVSICVLDVIQEWFLSVASSKCLLEWLTLGATMGKSQLIQTVFTSVMGWAPKFVFLFR